MFELNDICFCTNFECSHHDCRRHPINTPSDDYITRTVFECNKDGSCNYFYDIKKG